MAVIAVLAWRFVGSDSASENAALTDRALAAVAALNAEDVSARVEDGTVILSGTVPSSEARQRVLAGVAAAVEPARVLDELDVVEDETTTTTQSPSTSTTLAPPSAEEVLTRATAVLATHGLDEVTATFANRQITLSGSALDRSAVDAAIVDLSNLDGVAAVIDDIDIGLRALSPAELSATLQSRPVLFATDSSELDATAVLLLDEIASLLIATPTSSFELHGHVDPAEQANLHDLTHARVDAVAAHLIAAGIDPSRIGARRGLSAEGADPANPAGNPRVDIVITS